MAVLFHDVYEYPQVRAKTTNWRYEFNITDLLCADDTLLIATTTEAINALLAATEAQA